ncbi:MAG TPA: thioredoxin domain-containing protein [Candidatus Sulfotelmatobacter sp.]|nr:thioredoxin domain-containing protein [Candidatus Sulfotelmatobacter sp.]
MSYRSTLRVSSLLLLGLALCMPLAVVCQDAAKPSPAPPAPAAPANAPAKRNPAVDPERQDLQKAIESAANDRAALVKNLEAFLQKYPESSQRPQIYRALVESSLQLRDFPRAMDYSERLTSLNPEDISNTVLTIQLLNRYGDVPGYRRAVFYCSRVLEYVDRAPTSEKSPRVSTEDWEASKKKDRSSLLLIRGDLYLKLNDNANAQKDFEASYALIPNAAAAERLGNLAELNKDLNTAIQQYARAFALTDGTNGASSRVELRKKIGNVWRLAHGSEDGLGDYLLHAFDASTAAAAPAKPAHNQGGKEPYDFVLRKVSDGSPVRLADAKGKIIVLSFWATWCGPCQELEPLFAKVATLYAGKPEILFYALNCDDDESLVAPYLAKEKLTAQVLFADGLDRLLRVDSFPTTVILDRTGKIAFREDGFDEDGFEKSLTQAIDRALAPANAPPSSAAAANH